MRTIITVSWVSFNHDPYERDKNGQYRLVDSQKTRGPTLEFLFGEGSPLAGKTEKHYVFVRVPQTPDQGLRDKDSTESEVAHELKREIAPFPDAPAVEIIPWHTDATPIDHAALFEFTVKALGNIRLKHPNSPIAVNLSPGTPAAQTVLLLALQARVAGDNVRAYQGTPQSKRLPGQSPLKEVPWDLFDTLSAKPSEIQTLRQRGEKWTLEKARSPKLREVSRLVSEYGGVPFPVLIIGARGTGKTTIARDLRKGFLKWQTPRSSHRPGPKGADGRQMEQEWSFHLNCAEFMGNPDMLRSTLSGYEPNTFTGANKQGKTGLLELAHNDCVFLDEIHWMDVSAQALLLLALQREGSIRRIGGDKSIPVKFRLIAATNRPFEVLRENLNADFLDRITDLVIELPELCDCAEDLDDIWESVLLRAYEELLNLDERRSQTPLDGLLSEFRPHRSQIVSALRSMRLPGNYRDLERLARRLIVAGLAGGRQVSMSGDTIKRELQRLRDAENSIDMPMTGPSSSLIDELPTQARCERFLRDVQATGASFPGDAAIEQWERRLLYAAQAVSGSGTKAAGLIGMHPRTFNLRLKTWNRKGGGAG